jgi:hypothetical protein
MNIIFSVIREDTFWKILLFIHFLIAVSLLAGVTLQAATVLMPVRQVAGKFIDRGPVPTASYAPLILILYVLQVLVGSLDLHQVPHLRQNPDGGASLFLDCGII